MEQTNVGAVLSSGVIRLQGTREPDPGDQSPDSSGRYAENHRAFDLALAGGQQFPQPGDGSAGQFRWPPTHLAPFGDLLPAVALSADGSPRFPISLAVMPLAMRAF